jgi:hypothetical protein
MKQQLTFWKLTFLSRILRNHSSLKIVLFITIFLHASLLMGQSKTDNARVFTWDNASFLTTIAKAPLEQSANAEAQSVVFNLPMLDGTLQSFKFVESPVLEAALVPNWLPIKTYQGHSNDLKTIVWSLFATRCRDVT